MTMRYSLRNRILNEYVIPIGILVQQNLYNWNNRKLREEVMSPKAQLGGIYPRSEQLIELTRSYDRAKTDLDTVKRHVETDTLELVRLRDILRWSLRLAGPTETHCRISGRRYNRNSLRSMVRHQHVLQETDHRRENRSPRI